MRTSYCSVLICRVILFQNYVDFAQENEPEKNILKTSNRNGLHSKQPIVMINYFVKLTKSCL